MQTQRFKTTSWTKACVRLREKEVKLKGRRRQQRWEGGDKWLWGVTGRRGKAAQPGAERAGMAAAGP
jgi:hypothetical protein